MYVQTGRYVLFCGRAYLDTYRGRSNDCDRLYMYICTPAIRGKKGGQTRGRGKYRGANTHVPEKEGLHNIGEERSRRQPGRRSTTGRPEDKRRRRGGGRW